MTAVIRLAIGDPVAIELTPEGEPPTELRLFRAGKNPSTKGDFIFDDKAARDVIETYRAMGRNWVMADYDHGSLLSNPTDPSKSSKSAGRAKLEVRNGELWATDIKWTPEAHAGIKAGEWPSISPAFKRDDEGRPYWLVNFALTGNPSLFSPEELMAANALLELEELSAIKYTAYPLDESPTWDADAAEARWRKWASSDGSGDKETMDWAKYGLGFGYVDQSDRENFRSYKLLHHDIVDGKPVTSKAGTQAAAGALRGARRGVILPASDRGAVESHIGRHYGQWDEKAPWARSEKTNLIEELKAMASIGARLKAVMKKKGMTDEQMMKALDCTPEEYAALMDGEGGMDGDAMKKLAQLETTMADIKNAMGEGMKANVLALSLRMSGDATEEQIVDRLSALARCEAELLSVTGAKSVSEAHGTVAGWKDAAGKLAEVTEKLSALEEQGRKDRVAKAIEQAKADKKLTPAEAEQLSIKGEGDPEWLEAYLKVKPPVAALSTTHKQPQTEPDTKGKTGTVDLKGRTFEQLSNNEKSELHAVDKDQYEALRDDWAARGKPLPVKAA